MTEGSMEREEILARSRAENKKQDIYEKEILKQEFKVAVIVISLLATLFL